MKSPARTSAVEHVLRMRALMASALRRLELDLRDMVVLTEAASGPFMVTPILAALAGARKVYAIAKDSPYGRAKDVARVTLRLAKSCGVPGVLEIIEGKPAKVLAEAEVVTNLGFVRPLDADFIRKLNPRAVIPLMCEAWEARKTDLDWAACKAKEIPVMGTNESHPLVDVIRHVGPLCARMLQSLRMEVPGSTIAIVSRDRMGRLVERFLRDQGARVKRLHHLAGASPRKYLRDTDALVIADYCAQGPVLGRNSPMSIRELVGLAPFIRIVQFTGGADAEELDRAKVRYYPEKQVPLWRMGCSLAELGPKPVIDLHAAGLKVGEAMQRGVREGLKGKALARHALRHSPAQEVTPPEV